MIKQNKKEFLTTYFDLLCDHDYPSFIDKYLKVGELQRLKTVGQFCGSDYALYDPLFFYSRFDHSVAVALMTWHFTHSKKQTLCALFHDLGTPCFSHCIDFLLGDTIKQESSEKDVFKMISSSPAICSFLIEDQIDVEELKNPEQYPVVENKNPKICVDRLEGIFHTVLVWLHTHSLSDIASIHPFITVLKNEYEEEELGFSDQNKAEEFFAMAYIYSIELQSNKDKFVMQYTADSLNQLMEYGLLSLDQLYTQPENKIVKQLETFAEWRQYEKSQTVFASENEPAGYFVSQEVKKRYVIPLCYHQGKSVRLNQISSFCQNKLDEYFQYKEETYAFIPGLSKILTLK